MTKCCLKCAHLRVCVSKCYVALGELTSDSTYCRKCAHGCTDYLPDNCIVEYEGHSTEYLPLVKKEVAVLNSLAQQIIDRCTDGIIKEDIYYLMCTLHTDLFIQDCATEQKLIDLRKNFVDIIDQLKAGGFWHCKEA